VIVSYDNRKPLEGISILELSLLRRIKIPLRGEVPIFAIPSDPLHSISAVQYGYFLAHSLWRHIRMITRSVHMKYYMLNPSMKIAAA